MSVYTNGCCQHLSAMTHVYFRQQSRYCLHSHRATIVQGFRADVGLQGSVGSTDESRFLFGACFFLG